MGMEKTIDAMVSAGEGTSHKARLRRKKREMKEEATKALEHELRSDKGRFGGDGKSKGDARLRMFIDKAAGSAEHDFDWLRCLMYPSEENKCRIPDPETTMETSLNYFRNTGVLTTSGTVGNGNLKVCFAPFLANTMLCTAFSGAGYGSTWGDLGTATNFRSASQTADYTAAVPYSRCCGYAVKLRFNGSFSTTTGQFAIAEAPPGFGPSSLSDIIALPGSRYGTIAELFKSGHYYFFGSFYSVNTGARASQDTGGVPTFNMLAFHPSDQLPHNAATGGALNVPHIVMGFEGLVPNSPEISIDTHQVFEGLPDSTVVPRSVSRGSSPAMAVAKLASEPALRDRHIGHQKHHQDTGEGLVSDVLSTGKKAGNWVINHWDEIEHVGSEVLGAAGKAAGFLGPLAMALL